MRDLLSNPWIITVGGAVLAGIVLYFLVGRTHTRRHLTSQEGSPATGQHVNISPVVNINPTVTIASSAPIVGPAPVPTPIQTLPNSPSPVCNTSAGASPMDLTPKQIMDHLRSLPPYQMHEARKNYKGISVKWAVEFVGVQILGPNSLRVYGRACGTSSHIGIICTLDPNTYPQFRIISQGHPFTIQGTIEYVDDYFVIIPDKLLF